MNTLKQKKPKSMTETLTLPQPVSATEAPLQDVPTREAVLRQLLPLDYEQAQAEGLIDMFQVDEDTGKDGLLHTLTGNIVTSTAGGMIAEGFHHEPSAEILWPSERVGENTYASTRVDRTHLEDSNSGERAKYREFPLEPYQSQVVINGLRKRALHKDAESGEAKLVPAKNTMYPKEYDTFKVLRSVKEAYDNRDVEKEFASKDVDGRDVVVSQGSSMMMDGKTEMPIRIIIDAQTGKIRTAIPVTKRKPGIMKLTDKDAEKLIFGPLYKEEEK